MVERDRARRQRLDRREVVVAHAERGAFAEGAVDVLERLVEGAHSSVTSPDESTHQTRTWSESKTAGTVLQMWVSSKWMGPSGAICCTVISSGSTASVSG